MTSTAPPAAVAAPQGPAATSREPTAPPVAAPAPSTTALLAAARSPSAATSVPSSALQQAASAPLTAAQQAASAPTVTVGHQQSGGTRKRKLESRELQNSTYFKIRAIVRDLRPAFIGVLSAPDFQNCKAADDIRKQMKVLSELSKQLGVELGQPQLDKPPSAPEKMRERSLKHDSCIPSVANQDSKDPSIPEEMMSEAKGLQKQLHGYQGTFVVGGSPMGWNFLVYRGSEPVYYGVAKEVFRSRRSDKPSDD